MRQQVGGTGDITGALDALTEAEDDYPYAHRVVIRLSLPVCDDREEIGTDTEDIAKSSASVMTPHRKSISRCSASGGSEDTDMINLKNLMQRLKGADLIR